MLEPIGTRLDDDVPPKVVKRPARRATVLLVILEELPALSERAVKIANDLYQRLAVPPDLAGAGDAMAAEGFLSRFDDLGEDSEVLSEVFEFPAEQLVLDAYVESLLAGMTSRVGKSNFDPRSGPGSAPPRLAGRGNAYWLPARRSSHIRICPKRPCRH